MMLYPSSAIVAIGDTPESFKEYIANQTSAEPDDDIIMI